MTLGLGSVIATAASTLPWLTVIGRYKNWIFLGTGLLLALNWYLVMVLPARRNCKPGEICHIGSGVSRTQRALFWVSLGVYGIAFLISFGGQYYAIHYIGHVQ